MVIYFAYGSNLDWQNWSEFCAHHGADPHCMKPLEPAFLPDVELVFNYRSVLREGGALNVQPRKGQIVHGALFEVTDRGWEVLDLKESVAADCYARTQSLAITRGGRTTPVVTYVVTPARTERFVAPSDEYTDIVLRGLATHGLAAAQYHKCAGGHRPDPEVEGVFVYGTLMRDESRSGAIEKHGPAQTLHGHTRGRLHETAADYPMLDLRNMHSGHAARSDDMAHRNELAHGNELVRVNDLARRDAVAHRDGVVYGEFVRFPDMAPVLETLDEVEEFAGYASLHNEYVRTLVEVDTGEDVPRRAWTYVAGNRAAIGRHIESGCWRTFRGVQRPRAQLEKID